MSAARGWHGALATWPCPALPAVGAGHGRGAQCLGIGWHGTNSSCLVTLTTSGLHLSGVMVRREAWALLPGLQLQLTRVPPQRPQGTTPNAALAPAVLPDVCEEVGSKPGKGPLHLLEPRSRTGPCWGASWQRVGPDRRPPRGPRHRGRQHDSVLRWAGKAYGQLCVLRSSSMTYIEELIRSTFLQQCQQCPPRDLSRARRTP